jgi:hypothetical protein
LISLSDCQKILYRAPQKYARTRLTNLTGLVVGQWNEAASD